MERLAQTRRQEILEDILTRMAELVEPGARLGVVGDGDSPPRMPRTYTLTVRELEKLLVRMREERRSQWWHLNERYLKATESLKDVQVKRKTKHGKTVTVTERQLVTTWNPAVRLEKVRKGLAWLDREWPAGRVGEPFLPAETQVAA